MTCGSIRRSLYVAISVGIGMWAMAPCATASSHVSEPLRIMLSAPLGAATLRTFGGQLGDSGYDLVLLTDGGTLVVGQADNQGLSHRIVPGVGRALRLDPEGNVLWERDYNDDVDGMLYSPIQVDEGQFVILGQTVGSYARDEDDIHLIKIHDNGDLVWSRTFGGRGQDIGKMVRETSDGGFILVGSLADEQPSRRNGVYLYQSRIFLVKTDSEGNKVWSQTHGDEMLYLPWGVAETSDGGYVLAGWEAKTLDDRDVVLLKTDAQGALEWSRSWDLDPGERDGAFDLILTSDGNVLVCGIQSMNAGPKKGVLLKVDMQGNEVWLQRFGDGSTETEFWDVMEDLDGGYIACGARLSGDHAGGSGSTRHGFILKVDSSGEQLWEQVVSAPEYVAIHLSSAAVRPEGGYVFVGMAAPADADQYDMLWMKTESPVDRAITPENAASLAEASRFDVGMHVFELAFLSDTLLGVVDSERAAFWDLQSGEPQVAFTCSEIGRVIGVSHHGEFLAIYAPSSRLQIWTIDPLEARIDLCAIEDTEWPRAAFSADGRLLAVVNRWNEVEIWDLETHVRLQNCVGHHSNLFALAFSPDSRWLASGGGRSSRDDAGESFLGVWDVVAGNRLAWLPTEDLGDNHDLAFTLDGSRLISAGNRRMLAWDTQTWNRVYDSGPSYPGSYGISLSPDGTLLAIATDNRKLRIVETGTMRIVRELNVGVELMDVAFSPDGTRLAASLTDGTVRIWQAP